ncbi:MAG TPA: prolipoprotein diacylglyceryl transferase family protein [Acidimicrobiales bacterium]|jgi:phosphatidylglycerol:prolipoprotein diacylglycerol transferase|nr:prolipoprotein diacylglyceryl transferase family protein [Acidimicrobiales bacterium]
MRPIPVAFHIWFIEVHTYGIGLAITFWFALRYFERRVRNAGYPSEWVTGMFLWVIVAAIVGARIMSVIPNWSQYSSDPLQVFAIWQGGLSSFGGLILAVPVGIISARRRCPSIPTIRLLDLVAPVLMAAWGIGRLLGPQLMVNGGGHATHQWFGMYYAGEVGKRLPVPIFQAAMDFSIFGILLLIERWLRSQSPARATSRATADVAAGSIGATDVAADLGAADGHRLANGVADLETAGVGGSASPMAGAGIETAHDAASEGDIGGDAKDRGVPDGSSAADLERRRQLPPAGIIIGAGMVLWGIERFIDERLWLTDPSHVAFILVQVAGIALAVAGLVVLAVKYPALKKWRTEGPPVGGPFLGDPKPASTRQPAATTSSTSASSPPATTRSKTLASGDSS